MAALAIIVLALLGSILLWFELSAFNSRGPQLTYESLEIITDQANHKMIIGTLISVAASALTLLISWYASKNTRNRWLYTIILSAFVLSVLFVTAYSAKEYYLNDRVVGRVEQDKTHQ